MIDDNAVSVKNEESPELFPFRCPACGILMAQTASPDLTGWLRCQNRHRTVYRHGVPISTKRYGLPVRQNA